MFRQGLRTSAGLARRVLPQTATTLARQQRIAAQTIRPSLPTAHTWKAVTQFARLYSSEAAAESVQQHQENSKKPDEWTVQFADLADKGVNETLLRAITKDMGYQTMSPVQAKTIGPALKGTDMFVALPSHHLPSTC